MALKAAALKTVRPGRHPDGRYGLYFNVAGNSRTCVQRLTVDGKRRNVGLGPWPVVSLSEAREIAFENVRKRQRGINLMTGRKRAHTVPTFVAAADAYIALQAPGWKAGRRNESNWWSSLAHSAAIADRPVDAITTDDVLAVRVGGEVGRFRSLAGATVPGRERRRWPMRAGSSARRSGARVRHGPVVLPGGGRPASGGTRALAAVTSTPVVDRAGRNAAPRPPRPRLPDRAPVPPGHQWPEPRFRPWPPSSPPPAPCHPPGPQRQRRTREAV